MLTHHYRYDPLNRLTHSANSQRFYNHLRMTTEIQDAAHYSVFQSGETVLAQTRYDDGGSTCSLLASGFQRSVLQEVSPDGSRSIAYSAYGHSDEPGELGFNGERTDPVTGHYLLGNGYRAFNPVLMRFNSPDSWSPFGRGGINSYAYCSNNPVMNADPSGHAMFSFIKSLLFTGDVAKIPSQVLMKGIGKGVKQLPVEKLVYFDSFKKLTPDITIAMDTTKGGARRLNIQAHGNYDAVRGGYMGSSSAVVYADQLHALLARAQVGTFDTVRLITCYSAEGAANSLAKQLANLTHKPVKGYFGLVVSQDAPREVFEYFNIISGRQFAANDVIAVERANVIIKEVKRVRGTPLESTFNHRSMTYQPD